MEGNGDKFDFKLHMLRKIKLLFTSPPKNCHLLKRERLPKKFGKLPIARIVEVKRPI